VTTPAGGCSKTVATIRGISTFVTAIEGSVASRSSCQAG
jgi:hypothetical protein